MRKILARCTIVAIALVLGSSPVLAQQAVGPPPVKALTLLAAAAPISDEKKATDFYTRGLGMTAAGSNAAELFFTLPGAGASLALMKTKPGTALPVRSSLNRIVLAVPDLKALEARLKAAGYSLRGPIREVAQYRVAVGFVEDPDGNVIELVQRNCPTGNCGR